MKKIILALIAVFAVLMISDNANAQKKTKIADGLYLVSYGERHAEPCVQSGQRDLQGKEISALRRK